MNPGESRDSVENYVHEKGLYLECERPWVYWLLIFTAGWFGAYTFLLRGGVFCNAQTANVVLLAIAIGTGNWIRALYLLIPIGAYVAGAFVSALLGKELQKLRFLRWDTILIGIEILVVIALGLLPARAPDQICQVALNFICSMQFNTFRQVQGIPAATTFVTSHLREVGDSLLKYIKNRTPQYAEKVQVHGVLTLFFLAGGIVGVLISRWLGYYSICFTSIILFVIFIRLAHADRTTEKNLFSKTPHGH